MKKALGYLIRLKARFFWSVSGVRDAWVEQETFRAWARVNVVSIIAAFVLPLTAGERGLVIALGLVLLAAELLNTAIEYTVDYISTERHPLAGRAKDAASAGVFLVSIAGAVAWLLILWRLLIAG
ncbi:MAG: diacylglycerol kinase [Pseudomonadota bacterium]